MKPYEFSVIRYQHAGSSGELFNVGIVLWSVEDRRLIPMINERYGRLSKAYPGFDGVGFRQMIRTLVGQIDRRAEQIADTQRPLQSLSDLLQECIPVDAGCLQRSDPMGGIHPQPEERAKQLYSQFVLRFEAPTANARRDEQEIWSSIESKLASRGLLSRMQRKVRLSVADYEYDFRCGWQNGQLQVLEPISFDYIENREVLEQANKWGGRLLTLSRGAPFQFTAVVAAPQRGASADAFARAVRILRSAPSVRQVVNENDLDAYLPEIEGDIERH